MKRSKPLKPGAPLKRSSPLKPGDFRRKGVRENRAADNSRAELDALFKPETREVTVIFKRSRMASARAAMAADLNQAPVTLAKVVPVRSEAYLGAVRRMRCIDCGAAAPSQAAHMNLGKAGASKADDRFTFPLCPACHRRLDQPGPIEALDKAARRRQEARWVLATVRALILRQQWPAVVPRLKTEQWEFLERWASE